MIQSRAVLMVTCAGNTDIDKIMLHVYVRCFNKPLDSLVNVNDAAVSRKSRWHGQQGAGHTAGGHRSGDLLRSGSS